MLIGTAQNPRYEEGWSVAADMISEIKINERANPNLRITIKREYYNSSLSDWGQTNSKFLDITGLDLGPVDFRIENPNTYIW
jgi:hypothetical protein